MREGGIESWSERKAERTCRGLRTGVFVCVCMGVWACVDV